MSIIQSAPNLLIIACLIQSHPKRLLVLVLVLVWVKAAVRGVATPVKQAGREHYGQGKTYLYGLQEGGGSFLRYCRHGCQTCKIAQKQNSCHVASLLFSHFQV
jgi:hypothetical protein